MRLLGRVSRPRLYGLVALLAASLGLGAIHVFADRGFAVSSGVAKPAAAVVQVRFTGRTWYDKPVYELRNMTHIALRRVIVFSWSADPLPVLAIGDHTKGVPNLQLPLSSPPYTVPPGGSMWFVAPSFPPAKFTVAWESDGQYKYAPITAS